MDAKHAKAVMDLFNCGCGDARERLAEILERDGVTADSIVAAVNEILYENDVEGAAIGIAAVDLTYPEHGTEEHEQARSRVLDCCCPLLRLQKETEFSEALEERAEELMDVIFDAAERIAAGQTLGI